LGQAGHADVDIETQTSSLTDFTLRPLRAGDRVNLRPDEIRHVPVALLPTASIEVQVLLVAGDQRTPRAGVVMVLRDAAGAEAARARAPTSMAMCCSRPCRFGTFSAEAAGQTGAALTVSREAPDGQGKVLIPAANGA
jgi:hypothetical protein